MSCAVARVMRRSAPSVARASPRISRSGCSTARPAPSCSRTSNAARACQAHGRRALGGRRPAPAARPRGRAAARLRAAGARGNAARPSASVGGGSPRSRPSRPPRRSCAVAVVRIVDAGRATGESAAALRTSPMRVPDGLRVGRVVTTRRHAGEGRRDRRLRDPRRRLRPRGPQPVGLVRHRRRDDGARRARHVDGPRSGPATARCSPWSTTRAPSSATPRSTDVRR